MDRYRPWRTFFKLLLLLLFLIQCFLDVGRLSRGAVLPCTAINKYPEKIWASVSYLTQIVIYCRFIERNNTWRWRCKHEGSTIYQKLPAQLVATAAAMDYTGARVDTAGPRGEHFDHLWPRHKISWRWVHEFRFYHPSDGQICSARSLPNLTFRPPIVNPVN